MRSPEVPQRKQNREKDPDEKTDESLPTAATESVIADVHSHTSHANTTGSVEKGVIETLHREIQTCECAPVFDQYTRSEIPTFESMFGELPRLLEKESLTLAEEQRSYGAESVAEEMRVLKLLAGREQQIRHAVQQYVHSVVRFNNLKRLSAGGTRDIQKQFVDADWSRRRAHKSLIESLNIYRKTAAEAVSLELFSNIEGGAVFAEWDISTDARAIPKNKVTLMSEKTLKQRAFVRDWAIAAYFAGQLQILENTLQEEK